jgi:hypothetical protein
MDAIAGKLDQMFDVDRRDRDQPRRLILDPASAVVFSSFGDDDDHDDRH